MRSIFAAPPHVFVLCGIHLLARFKRQHFVSVVENLCSAVSMTITPFVVLYSSSDDGGPRCSTLCRSCHTTATPSPHAYPLYDHKKPSTSLPLHIESPTSAQRCHKKPLRRGCYSRTRRSSKARTRAEFINAPRYHKRAHTRPLCPARLTATATYTTCIHGSKTRC